MLKTTSSTCHPFSESISFHSFLKPVQSSLLRQPPCRATRWQSLSVTGSGSICSANSSCTGAAHLRPRLHYLLVRGHPSLELTLAVPQAPVQPWLAHSTSLSPVSPREVSKLQLPFISTLWPVGRGRTEDWVRKNC